MQFGLHPVFPRFYLSCVSHADLLCIQQVLYIIDQSLRSPSDTKYKSRASGLRDRIISGEHCSYGGTECLGWSRDQGCFKDSMMAPSIDPAFYHYCDTANCCWAYQLRKGILPTQTLIELAEWELPGPGVSDSKETVSLQRTSTSRARSLRAFQVVRPAICFIEALSSWGKCFCFRSVQVLPYIQLTKAVKMALLWRMNPRKPSCPSLSHLSQALHCLPAMDHKAIIGAWNMTPIWRTNGLVD